jgi:hypothetical protein
LVLVVLHQVVPKMAIKAVILFFLPLHQQAVVVAVVA